MTVRQTCLAAALSALVAAPVLGQDLGSVGDGSVLFGINRHDGELVRYDFSGPSLTQVGKVTVPASGEVLLGIDAAAYVPGFQNLYAFWLDPSDDTCKLVYVDAETGEAAVVHDLEGGKMAGAVAALTAQPDGSAAWTVYGMQLKQVTPPFEVGGRVNINPNNSKHNEFELVNAGNGFRITRDDLHRDADISGSGTFYEGPASYVRVKPKGNGNQNGLIINGEAFRMQNSNTYALNGEMQVRVYNDHPHNGRAMGHWWIEVTGTANWLDDVEVQTPDRLVKVDHMHGVVTELMTLSRGYDGLATTDGVTFYATHGSQLWKLDPASETETLVGTMPFDRVFGLEFCGETLTGFELVQNRLTMIDALTGERIDSGLIGAANLGTIVYCPLHLDPTLLADAYD